MAGDKTLGLVGVGNIGKHFAARLLNAGWDVLVYDRNVEAAQKAVSGGGSVAESLEDLASRTETILLSLPTPQSVQAVVEELCAAEGATTKLVVDLSTTGPAVTREIAPRLSDAGIEFVGAPVSGGTANAEQGKLALMAGGPQSAFEGMKPVFDVLGKNVFYIGDDPSLGQTIKIINNTLYATSMIASCEALVYGIKAGLDAQTMLDVINTSSGRSFSTLERIPQCALDGSFPLRFSTELLHKDVKMCLDDAERIGAPMQVNPVARQFLAFAMTQGQGDRDNVEVLKFIEEWAGVELRAATTE